eukprot:COSAG02_NODE_31677_length_529_cov_0.876744_1_plen_64_part_00
MLVLVLVLVLVLLLALNYGVLRCLLLSAGLGRVDGEVEKRGFLLFVMEGGGPPSPVSVGTTLS